MKRWAPIDLLNHQFTMMYNQFHEDEDHIRWLNSYKESRDNLANANKQIKVNLNDYGLEDLVGLN